MGDSVQNLARELKRFLAAQDEAEFLLTAAPICAADSVPAATSHIQAGPLPAMKPNSTLTVDFPAKNILNSYFF